MGSIGTASRTSTSESLQDKSITSLQKYTDWKEGNQNIRKDFDLDFATTAQIDAIRNMLKGVLEYDKGYDADKTPFNIHRIDIHKTTDRLSEEEKQRNKELFGKTMEDKTISFNIWTIPNSDNAYIRMMDEKHRQGLIGPGGGFYEFTDGGKRKNLKLFDVQYGKRSGF